MDVVDIKPGKELKVIPGRKSSNGWNLLGVRKMTALGYPFPANADKNTKVKVLIEYRNSPPKEAFVFVHCCILNDFKDNYEIF